jgi:hypothetical protein
LRRADSCLDCLLAIAFVCSTRNTNSRIREEVILANTPAWLRKLFSALLYYFIIFFVVFAYRNFPNKTTSELVEVQMFSACAAGFYSGIAALLTSYAGTDHPLSLNEI